MTLNLQFIYPVFAMVLLSAAILVIMFVARIRAVKTRTVRMSYFKTYQGEIPEWLALPARHFSNLFEAPVLFYPVCLLGMMLPMDPLNLNLAWAYVFFRVCHAIIHLSVANIRPRLAAYSLSWIVLLASWIRIVLSIS